MERDLIKNNSLNIQNIDSLQVIFIGHGTESSQQSYDMGR